MEKYIVFEIGANNGSHTQKFLDKENSYVYAFEPLPNLYKLIGDRFSERNNLELYNIAVSDFDGESEFGISDPTEGAMDYGCSSLYEFTENIEELWPNRKDFKFIEKIKVNVVRMDTFLSEKNITKIDYLHCDAQGSDLRVLKSFGKYIEIIKSGVVEAANKVNLYNTDNSVDSIIEFLEKNNFKILNKWDANSSNPEIDLYFEKL